MAISARQQQYLNLMGIQVWQDKTIASDPEAVVTPQVVEDESSEWQKLRGEVSSCEKCELCEGRTQTVFGVGDPKADWLIVGEAPGAEEDKQGEPFVGRAGKLLNAMLDAIGPGRDSVYIANILKCRPPNNRDPKPEEVNQCENYLDRQIRLVQPRIILAVGRIAAQNLLKLDTPIGKMRGQRYYYPGSEIPVIVTYHPAYLLRSPQEKRKSWQDLQLALKVYGEAKEAIPG